MNPKVESIKIHPKQTRGSCRLQFTCKFMILSERMGEDYQYRSKSWNMFVFETSIFRGKLAVSFREGNPIEVFISNSKHCESQGLHVYLSRRNKNDSVNFVVMILW